MTYKNRVKILFSTVVLWAIGTVIGTHNEAEPYPAMAYPGFGSKGRKHLVYYELYHLKKDEISEIQHYDTPFMAARYRRFLKNIHANLLENNKVKLNTQIRALTALKFTDEFDTLFVVEKRANWERKNLELRTIDSLRFQLTVID